jgi:hypothetical protein
LVDCGVEFAVRVQQTTLGTRKPESVSRLIRLKDSGIPSHHKSVTGKHQKNQP